MPGRILGWKASGFFTGEEIRVVIDMKAILPFRSDLGENKCRISLHFSAVGLERGGLSH